MTTCLLLLLALKPLGGGSPRPVHIASKAGVLLAESGPGEVSLYRLADGEKLSSFDAEEAYALSPQGTYVATVQKGWLNIWDAQTGDRLHRVGCDRIVADPPHLSFSWDERRLLVICFDARVFDVATGRQHGETIEMGKFGWDRGALSPDGENAILRVNLANVLCLADVKTGKPELLADRASAHFCFSADGKYLAYACTDPGDGRLLRIVRADKPHEKREFKGPEWSAIWPSDDGGFLIRWQPGELHDDMIGLPSRVHGGRIDPVTLQFAELWRSTKKEKLIEGGRDFDPATGLRATTDSAHRTCVIDYRTDEVKHTTRDLMICGPPCGGTFPAPVGPMLLVVFLAVLLLAGYVSYRIGKGNV